MYMYIYKNRKFNSSILLSLSESTILKKKMNYQCITDTKYKLYTYIHKREREREIYKY